MKLQVLLKIVLNISEICLKETTANILDETKYG
jgi:hypothetical protein